MQRHVEAAAGLRERPARRTRTRTATIRLAAAAAIVLTTVGPRVVPAVARDPGPRASSDAVTVFASAPAPGHPFGIAVDGDRVYVSTSAGDFFADPANGGHKNSDDERVFTYDKDGSLLERPSSTPWTTPTMGLFGLALDGNPEPRHKLYVADMNGRILRVDLGSAPRRAEVFSQVPVDPGLAGGWMLSMWNDLVFDKAGNLYVPDDKPRIWRVAPGWHGLDLVHGPSPDGLLRLRGWAARRPDRPDRRVAVLLDHGARRSSRLEAVIYRVRLVDHPTAADLELVHRFPVDPTQAPPQATGLAFAKSGNLYVSLLGPNQVAVLDPAGNEIRRISDPRFHSPWGLAFLGNIAPGDQRRSRAGRQP